MSILTNKNTAEVTELEIFEEGTILGDFQKERTDAISEMFDNVGDDGIYPTTEFFRRLDKALLNAVQLAVEGEIALN